MNKYMEAACKMDQTARRALARKLADRGYPSQYVLNHDDPTPFVTVDPTRKKEIGDSLRELARDFYGVSSVQVTWRPDKRQRGYNPYAGLNFLSAPQGSIGSGRLISLSLAAKMLWMDDYPEAVTAVITTQMPDIILRIQEHSTRWVDSNGDLHKQDGPAIYNPHAGIEEFYWHGKRISPALFKHPHDAGFYEVVREPGFSLIGGFKGLRAHKDFSRVVSNGSATIYEGGGHKTYWAQRAESRGEQPKGKIWQERPHRFLYDPHGHSGWISKNVKTIPGAQRSLLRKKLTQYTR